MSFWGELISQLVGQVLGEAVERAFKRMSCLTQLILLCLFLLAIIFFLRWLAGDTAWLDALTHLIAGRTLSSDLQD